MSFPYSDDERRWHTFSYETKRLFGKRAVKVMLEAGMSCPNRDGTKGVGGCRFCSSGGASDSNPHTREDLLQQYRLNRELLRKKWPEALCIPYFQSFSNTYAPVEKVKEMCAPFLQKEEVAAIALATRADCLPPEMIDCLCELQQQKPVWLELGLQTVHDETARRMNRCHSYAEFREMVFTLAKTPLRVCVHLINGLPGESKEDMLESVRELAGLPVQGIKFHMLNILSDAPLAQEYRKDPFPLLSQEEYIDLLVGQLELLPPQITVERICSDPPRRGLLAPSWVLERKKVQNALKNELIRRDSYQGKSYERQE